MAAFDLTFTLEQDPPYFAGREYEGTLWVKPKRNLRVSQITISFGWRTLGPGKEDGEFCLWNTSFERADFYASEIYPYSFFFPILLNGPFSYEGDYCRVEYFLRAQIHIPAEKDVYQEMRITVLPDPEAEGILYYCGSGFLTLRSKSSKSDKLAILRFLIFGSFFVGLYFYSIGLPQVGILSGVLFFGLFVFLLGGNFFARWRITAPLFEIQKNTFFPGEEIPFGVSFCTKGNVQVKRVQIKLICEEKVISVVRNNTITYSKMVLEKGKSYLLEQDSSSSEEKKVLDHFQIPPNFPYYFSSKHNTVFGYLELTIDLKFWRNFRVAKPVYILPKGYQTK